eukprot:COSAG06_NODE_31196_length_525_cov_1.190141_2_plen_54_part_01
MLVVEKRGGVPAHPSKIRVLEFLHPEFALSNVQLVPLAGQARRRPVLSLPLPLP